MKPIDRKRLAGGFDGPSPEPDSALINPTLQDGNLFEDGDPEDTWSVSPAAAANLRKREQDKKYDLVLGLADLEEDLNTKSIQRAGYMVTPAIMDSRLAKEVNIIEQKRRIKELELQRRKAENRWKIFGCCRYFMSNTTTSDVENGEEDEF